MGFRQIFAAAALTLAPSLVAAASKSSSCASSAIAVPSLLGVKVLNIAANEVHNYNGTTTYNGYAIAANYTDLNFCNVTVTYTHPGQNDTINLTVWLPLSGWNGRFMGTGGAGWTTGSPSNLIQPVSDGYAAAATDGGHSALASPQSWLLLEPGNVNLYLLQDFASVALYEISALGKQVTTSYYDDSIKYSYWTGCSTGGRQGMMIAQRYPNEYDGIIADSPAINWVEFIPAEYWPQLLMNIMDYYPPQCQFDAIINATIAACDDLDGVKDGIISEPGLCKFNPLTVVNKTFDCNGVETSITEGAAQLAKEIYAGPEQWYGLLPGASFSGLANTSCSANGTCVGAPFQVTDWLSLIVERGDPTFNPLNLTVSSWSQLFHESVAQWSSVIATNDPDLSQFKAHGGKLLTWHGLADQLIFPNGTVRYYDEVLKLDRDASDFYRFFEAPGTVHCAPGNGPYPVNELEALVNWVENRTAPEVLEAVTQSGPVITRNLCPYPKVQTYIGGNPDVPSSFACK